MLQIFRKIVCGLLSYASNKLLFCDKGNTMYVHSSRIKKQLEYLSSLGIDIEPVYKQAGISREEAFSADRHFSFEQYNTILEFALRQTGNPEYGLAFGSQPQIGGTIGMLSASCKNLMEAFSEGCRFLRLQTDTAELRFEDPEKNPRLVYRLSDSWELRHPHTARLEVDTMFAFLNTILKINSNGAVHARAVHYTFRKPEHPEKYAAFFGLAPQFGRDENILFLDRAYLKIPMKAFNPESYSVLNSYLEEQLERLVNGESVSDKVKRVLHNSFRYRFPDMETVAEKLLLSPRTLQRKLAEEQTTFKEILQEARFGIAKNLLLRNVLSVSDIAFTLGYSDLANFSRSFKRYTGTSPQEYRDGN